MIIGLSKRSSRNKIDNKKSSSVIAAVEATRVSARKPHQENQVIIMTEVNN
jgi:hypothetical protein